MTNEHAWIETFTGKRFHILEPQLDEIDIRDIAHGLSNLCRFTGQTSEFYSVAEHSFFVSHLVPPQDALAGLLHDASEAYISDISRPLKHFTSVGEPYREIEARITLAVALKFGITHPVPKTVHKADLAMLWTEKDQLMPPNADSEWKGTTGEDFRQENQERAKVIVVGWDPEWAERIFLDRYYTLSNLPNPRLVDTQTPGPSEEKPGV